MAGKERAAVTRQRGKDCYEKEKEMEERGSVVVFAGKYASDRAVRAGFGRKCHYFA